MCLLGTLNWKSPVTTSTLSHQVVGSSTWHSVGVGHLLARIRPVLPPRIELFFVLDWRWPGEEKEPMMLCAPDAETYNAP